MEQILRDYNSKIASLIITVLFILNGIAYGIDMPTKFHLRVSIGGESTYSRVSDMMQKGYKEHEESVDVFIKKYADKSIALKDIPELNAEFMAAIISCGANDMLDRLNKALEARGGRIQIIFVDKEDELPVFKSYTIFGHAGTYITVFAIRGQEKTDIGRREIIARIFHEIRKRSIIARERFNKINWDIVSKTKAQDKVSQLLRIFDNESYEMQRQIVTKSKIEDPDLLEEFKNLEFDEQYSNMLRHYGISFPYIIIKLGKDEYVIRLSGVKINDAVLTSLNSKIVLEFLSSPNTTIFDSSAVAFSIREIGIQVTEKAISFLISNLEHRTSANVDRIAFAIHNYSEKELIRAFQHPKVKQGGDTAKNGVILAMSRSVGGSRKMFIDGLSQILDHEGV